MSHMMAEDIAKIMQLRSEERVPIRPVPISTLFKELRR
jgi:hypothetical protein